MRNASMRILAAVLLATAGFVLGRTVRPPSGVPSLPKTEPVRGQTPREDDSVLREELRDREILISLLRKEIAEQDRRRTALEAELARKPPPAGGPHDARNLSPEDLKRLEACRQAFLHADGTTSIEKSRSLLAWLSIGDPEEWVRYVFGPENRRREDANQSSYLQFYVPGQDVIHVQIYHGKVETIFRGWDQPGEG